MKLEYRLTSAEDLAAASPRYFDIITCMEMLEHVPEPEQVMSALATLVRPGEQVFISTINRNLKAFLLAIVGAEYLLRLLPREHTRIRTLHPPVRAGRMGPRLRPRSRRSRGDRIQPDHQAFSAERRCDGELPGASHACRNVMAARNAIKGVLFDLDGTLLDTAPDMAQALNRLAYRTRRARDSLRPYSPRMSRMAPWRSCVPDSRR